MIYRRFARLLSAGMLTVLVAAVAGVIVAGTALADVTNGGFEQPLAPAFSFSTYFAGDATSIPGWVVAAGSVDVLSGSGGFPVHGGLQSLDLNGNSPGTIYQDVPTVESHSYQLTFYLSSNVACTPGPRTLTVTAGASTASYTYTPDPTASPANQPFLAEVLTFTGAAGATTRVQFASTSGDCAGPVLDDVSVVDTTPAAAADQVAPQTTATLSPAANANGWNNTSVTVALSATDNPGGSGVKSITYSASGAQPIASTTVPSASASVTFTQEGVSTLTYAASDNAGNVEAQHTLVVRVDKTAPEAFNQFDPTTLDAQLFGRDAGSGVPAGAVTPTTVTPNAQGELRTYTVMDAAGNKVVVKEQVQRQATQTTASIVSLQSCTTTCGPAATPTSNQQKIEVVANPDGSKTIEQKFVLGGKEVDAEFSSATNKTTIKTLVNGKQVSQVSKPGLVLLRLATSAGGLNIEVP